MNLKQKVEVNIELTNISIHSDFAAKIFGWSKLIVNDKDMGYIQDIQVVDQVEEDDYITTTCKFKGISK